MARKSRKDSVAVTKALEKIRNYRTAVYVRLSNEDERKIDSDTVENQIEFLKDFVSKESSLNLEGIYVDRSVSGTTFDRPQFNKMIADVRVGKINCVVVKDLSRLGRNYLEAGDYIEKIFPFFGVRFIAVTDNYDSLTSNPSEDGLIVPLKNLINEAYAKDISKKVSTSCENLFKQGIFIATTAAYGYKKIPDDPHMVAVDEEVKDIVIRIFNDYVAGKSLAAIARELNAEGVLAPSVYWQEKDVIHVSKYNNLWEGKQIRRMIENPIYVGDVQLSKTKKCYYKGITKAYNRKDGYYVKDHHEPIIDRETFNRAQKRLRARKEKYNSNLGKYDDVRNQKQNILQGFIYCGDCGNSLCLHRKTVRLVSGVGYYNNYYCRRSTVYGDADPQKHIKAEDIENLVLELIKQHIAIYIDAKERLKILNRSPEAADQRETIQSKIAEAINRKERVAAFIQNLYEDFADGVFSETEYLQMKSEYVAEIEQLDASIEELQKSAEVYSTDYVGEKHMATAFSKYVGVETLSRELVEVFIKRINCYSNSRFEVEYTFSDELKAMLDIIEERS